MLLTTLLYTSCGNEQSGATGWDYNDSKNGGFQKAPFIDQETGPGLVLIEGGRFTMGRTEQDVMYDWNNVPRTVTVPSFYMDETEITNAEYREFVVWVRDSIVRTQLAILAEEQGFGAASADLDAAPSGGNEDGIQKYKFETLKLSN